MFKEFVAPVVSWMQGEAAKDEADKMERDRKNAIAQYDDNPYYLADSAPKYQQTKSPVARAYLESFLTGTNPAMIRSTGADSNYEKQVAQSQFDQRYGGWDAIQRAQDAELADNSRFQPQKPTRPPEAEAASAANDVRGKLGGNRMKGLQTALTAEGKDLTDAEIVKYGDTTYPVMKGRIMAVDADGQPYGMYGTLDEAREASLRMRKEHFIGKDD